MQPHYTTQKNSTDQANPAAHQLADFSSVPFLEELNPAQLAAVTHGNGPILVIAGAGSGKTRTLVHRMAHLVANGVDPESILLLTFTRRAAQNMLWRATQLTGSACRRVMGGTFHATANILLRQYGSHIGIGSQFTIIDRADAEGIINLIKSSLGMGGASKRFPSKRVILNLISGAVNKNASLEELVLGGHMHLVEFMDDFITIAGHYRQFKLDHALMDYDDLLLNWKRLLHESQPARESLSNRFQHILVDEYQDTNHIQAEIVRLLAYCHDNVMVVGDDAQSIYSFRGADFANIMRFGEEFPGTRLIKLEQNYRSSKPILDLSNNIITHAEEKFTKILFTENAGGITPKLAICSNEGAEARFVADQIARLHAEGVALSDIAVLFRSAFHSFKLEIELASRNLGFEKRGGLKLTESAHIKDVLSFFRVTINPHDNLSWNRLLLQLDRVGPKTAQKIMQALSITDAPVEALAAYPAGSAWKAQLHQLCTCLASLAEDGRTPSEQLDLVMTYYQPIFEKIYFDDYPKRARDLEQIKALISGYGDLRAFVDDTALDPPEVADATSLDPASGQRLVLSTIHSAKGLEWEAVFIIGLAEGRFPNQHAVPGEQWEEERRLFYVAATRAKEQLFLSYPREMVGADRRFFYAGMSPFLAELKPELYESAPTSTPTWSREAQSAVSAHPGIKDTSEPGTHGASPASGQPQPGKMQELQPGMRVEHAFFGQGSVSRLSGPRRVEVLFDRHGSKILHLDYARLIPLS